MLEEALSKEIPHSHANPRENPIMFTLPSLWNLIISSLVFIIAAWYLHRYLEEQGLPKGLTRGTLVFALASLVSWGSGEMVDWAQEKIQGPQSAAKTSDDLLQLLKLINDR
jgi:predicted PurR-regulated permease PerM